VLLQPQPDTRHGLHLVGVVHASRIGEPRPLPQGFAQTPSRSAPSAWSQP
jgi:hypothetical protein